MTQSLKMANEELASMRSSCEASQKRISHLEELLKAQNSRPGKHFFFNIDIMPFQFYSTVYNIVGTLKRKPLEDLTPSQLWRRKRILLNTIETVAENEEPGLKCLSMTVRRDDKVEYLHLHSPLSLSSSGSAGYLASRSSSESDSPARGPAGDQVVPERPRILRYVNTSVKTL